MHFLVVGTWEFIFAAQMGQKNHIFYEIGTTIRLALKCTSNFIFYGPGTKSIILLHIGTECYIFLSP